MNTGYEHKIRLKLTECDKNKRAQLCTLTCPIVTTLAAKHNSTTIVYAAVRLKKIQIKV